MWVSDPNTVTLCLGAQSEVWASLLCRGRSLSHAFSWAISPGKLVPTTACKSSASPFRVPALSASHKVVSTHPWLSICSSGSPQLFISGDYSPLYFYSKCGSGRQCKINCPIPPPSCCCLSVWAFWMLLFHSLYSFWQLNHVLCPFHHWHIRFFF